MPRANWVEAMVKIRGETYWASGTVTMGGRPYYDRALGVMLPGDPDEVDIDKVYRADDESVTLDEDDLDRDEREAVEEALLCARSDR